MKEKTKAVTYLRYSSDNQNINSIAYQRSATALYAHNHNIEIVREYADEAVSGTTDQRPDFQELIEAVKAEDREWTVILIFSRDRMGRNVSDMSSFSNLCRDCGVTITSVQEDFGSADSSTMIYQIMDVISESQSRSNSQHTHAAMKQKAERAHYLGGYVPFGYRINEANQYIAEPEEARMVRRIFQMVDLDFSYREIAEEVNSKGFRTRSGKEFTKYSFSDLLRQEKYKGVYRWNRAEGTLFRKKVNSRKRKSEDQFVTVENGCPPIVDKELFERVQQKLNARKTGTATSKSREFYLLTGMKILKCRECGAYMIGKKMNSHGKYYTTYSCPNRKKGTCHNPDVHTEQLNLLVAAVISTNLFRGLTVEQAMKQVKGSSVHQQVLQKQKKELEKKIRAVTEALSHKYRDTLAKKLDELEARKKDVEKEIRISRPINIREQDKKALQKKLVKYLITKKTVEAKQCVQENISEIRAGANEIEVDFTVAA